MATFSNRSAAPLVSPTTVPYASCSSVGGEDVFVVWGGASTVVEKTLVLVGCTTTARVESAVKASTGVVATTKAAATT